jgi:capsular polysaccharide biosynthesis protein
VTVSEVRGRGAAPFKVRYAVRDHWVLALLPVVLLAAAAGVFAMKRTPTYTAEAKLTLGQLDVAAQAPSYVTAAQGLAATYSQAIHAGAVTKPAGKALGIPALEASKRLVASPIGQTPLFLVDAKGPSAHDAIKLANSASRALKRYVDGLNASAAGVNSSLRAYKRASEQQHRAAIAVQEAQVAYGRHPSIKSRHAVSRAQQRYDSAKLRANVLAGVYGNAKRVGSTSNVLQILATATAATNDRNSVAQKVLFIAAVAGLAIGVALAVRAGIREPAAEEEPAQRVKAAPAA